MTERVARVSAATAGIVADDLTGATDSAVQFARDGWKARLALTMPPPGTAEPGSVTAFVTDARGQPADGARANTASAVVGLGSSGVERLFLKIDSTLRGSVIDQIHGALEAWGAQHQDCVAVVCSAYPAMGRTIENGHILVNGQGVHTTSIGRDPVTPMTTSDLTELLPGSVGFALDQGTAAENAARLEAATEAAGAGGRRIIAADARTDDDLARLAEVIGLLGPRAVPAGAAGLAVALSRVWAARETVVATPATGPHAAGATPAKASGWRVVVVVSSLHDVSRTQVDQLMSSLGTDQVYTFAPPLDEVLTPETIAEWTTCELAKAPALPAVVVISSPSERPSHKPSGVRRAAELIAESLAIITDLVFEHDSIDAIMLLGGEGARAVLEHLGAEALRVHDAVREGIPRGSLEGGKADGVTVVTKAGGFGSPTSVAEIVAELLGDHMSTTRKGPSL